MRMLDYSPEGRAARAKARAEYMADVEVRYAAYLADMDRRNFFAEAVDAVERMRVAHLTVAQ